MWIITKDLIADKDAPAGTFDNAVGVTSSNYSLSGPPMVHRFRMKDDDGEIYYYGNCNYNDDERAFAPLDDFGMPNAGCTSIEYWNKATKKWEVL